MQRWLKNDGRVQIPLDFSASVLSSLLAKQLYRMMPDIRRASGMEQSSLDGSSLSRLGPEKRDTKYHFKFNVQSFF